MRHSIEWQDDAGNAAPEERATVGDFRLFIGSQNVTKHMLDDTVQDHVTVAMYGLASGLVHDWWTIFGARDREFSLRDYRTGYLVPDIRIQFDGSAFEVSAQQTAYDNPDVRFWAGSSEVLSRLDGEAWLSQLIGDVLSRLQSLGISDTSAARRWRRVQTSLHSDEQAFCEAAGARGLDPYEIADDEAAFIENSEAVFQQETLVEFVAGAGEVDTAKLISWVKRMNRSDGSQYRLPSLRPIADKIAADASEECGGQGWSRGYRRARALRKELNLDQHSRFASFRELALRLGGARSFNLAPKVDGISALRREGRHGVHVHLRNHGDTTAHLFALARAVGDVVCFPKPEAAPINSLRKAFRQAAGRAFAAEFLAPINEIRSMLADERDIYSISDEMHVSSMVVQHQIENQQRIDEACAI